MIKKIFSALVFVLIVGTVVFSPTAASATGGSQYVIAIWKNKAGDPKFPQYLVDSYKTSDRNPNVLAGYAKECGTFYQSDTYANDERTAKLIAGKVLRGGDESWPLDAKGNQIQRYSTLTTKPCPVVTPPVVTEPPVVVPPVVTPEPTSPVATPTPVPPVTTPEVPSSPVTPTTPTPSTSPTMPPTTSQTSPTPTPTVTPDTPMLGLSVAPSQRIAPVPTPIRTEAKFTG